MALPAKAEAKRILRIEDTSEDTLVDEFLARAKAAIEGLLGYPLESPDEATDFVDYSRLDEWDSPTVLQLPGPCVASGDDVPVVVDYGGSTVSADDYIVDGRDGKIRAKRGIRFTNGPYTITAIVAMDTHPDYTSTFEAVASQAILDMVAHLYLNRNPAATAESDEAGSAKTVVIDRVPAAVVQDLQVLPMRNGMALA